MDRQHREVEVPALDRKIASQRGVGKRLRTTVQSRCLLGDCGIFVHKGVLVATHVRIGSRTGDRVDLGNIGIHYRCCGRFGRRSIRADFLDGDDVVAGGDVRQGIEDIGAGDLGRSKNLDVKRSDLDGSAGRRRAGTRDGRA